MNTKSLLKQGVLIGMTSLCLFSFNSCSNDDDENKVLVVGIPSDNGASANPTLPGATNAQVPNFNYSVSQDGNWAVIRLDLTGIQDPNDKTQWIKLYGTGSPEQNIWLSIDGEPKGIEVVNNEDDTRTKNVDLVFLIDNSGSMDEESDSLAKSVYNWSQTLAKSNLNMRFACVGYDGEITGGINFGTISQLYDFLNPENDWYNYGTYRTRHFVEQEGDDWDNWIQKYYVSYSQDECGVAALRLASENFNFRSDANRVYVNFTDEPNYTARKSDWSVEYVKDESKWAVNDGTIHTVFSEDTIYYYNDYFNSSYYSNYYERPWRLSEYTGGTSKFVPNNFKGVSLDDLPVTGALRNSYVIRFTNIESLFDNKPHEFKITILSKDGSVRAERTIMLVLTR